MNWALKSKVQSALQLQTQDTMSTSSHTSRTIVHTCKKYTDIRLQEL